MKRLPLVLLSLIVAGLANATAQAPDILTMNGKTYSIHTNPLSPYLEAHPGKLPEPEVVSTGMWRGYIATWAVRDGRLFVDDVRMLTKDHSHEDESKRFRSVMKALFDDEEPHVASWYTGHLIVPTGEMIDYVHMGYGSTYSSYLVVTILRGEVKRQRELDAEEFAKFRRAQYAAFRKTPEYEEARAIAKSGDDPMSDEMTEDFLFQFTSAEYLSRIFDGSVQP